MMQTRHSWINTEICQLNRLKFTKLGDNDQARAQPLELELGALEQYQGT
jgi:hypothetical protein